MLRSTFFIFALVLSYSLLSQPETTSKNGSDCIIKSLGIDININDSIHLLKDSVYIVANNDLSSSYSKVFDIYNTTSKNIYIYAGLFNPDWLKQPYVHQYDKYTHSYTFSLTPLYKNFKNVFQFNSILDVHYNWYIFIELKPNQYYRLRTSIGEKYLNEEQNAIKSIPPQSPYEALKSPFFNLKDQPIQRAIIRVGYYHELNSLCDEKYFNQEELSGLQMRFTTISTDFLFWGK